jgi:hypothetical protein
MTPRLEEQGNPFATRRVRPGAIPYLFLAGEGSARVVERLRDSGWWGQIVGPHGSGKSTLLATLLPELRRFGKAPLLVALHDGQRRLPSEASAGLRALPPGDGIAVIDGYEQLSRWGRFWLRRQCRRGGHGLLVTAHRPAGLPELLCTGVTLETAWRVLTHLLPDAKGLITAAGLDARLTVWAGNLREVLFELYDLYETQRRLPPEVDTGP